MTQSAIFMQILNEVKERVLYDLSSLTQLMEADVIHGFVQRPRAHVGCIWSLSNSGPLSMSSKLETVFEVSFIVNQVLFFYRKYYPPVLHRRWVLSRLC